MKIGNRIRQAREKAGLSEKELSAKAGISFVTLSRIETGVYEPSKKSLENLATALNVTTDYLLGRTNHPDVYQNNEINMVKETPIAYGPPDDPPPKIHKPNILSLPGGIKMAPLDEEPPDYTEEEESRLPPLDDWDDFPATKKDIEALGTSLHDISTKLALLKHPEKPTENGNNHWKNNVISIIERAKKEATKEEFLAMKKRVWDAEIPPGAGVTYVDIEDLYAEEKVEIKFPGKVDYVTHVNGNSMQPYIPDGAMIYVMRNKFMEPYKDGDIAVVYVETTKEYKVRRIWFHQSETSIDIGLQSENPKTMEWHKWSEHEDDSFYPFVKLLGKVVGVEHQYTVM